MSHPFRSLYRPRAAAAAAALIFAAACGDGAVEPVPVPLAPTGPLVLAVDGPAEFAAGGTVTIRGAGFGTVPSQNAVILDGVPLTVTSASAEALVVNLPSTAFRCAPVRPVTLSVTAGGNTATRQVPLRTAIAQALAPGQSAVFTEAQRCVELPSAGSRYAVSVVNSGRAVGSVASFELAGSATGATVAGAPGVSGALIPSEVLSWSGDRAARAPLATPEAQAHRRRVQAHDRILEANRQMRSRLGAPGVPAAQISASPSTGGPSLSTGPTAGLQAPGDTATLRIPDINASNACATFFSVRTRVVYSGAHSILLEDVDAPLAGQMDETFKSIGDEFEQVMWPVLTANFGNPLAMDSRLDANGKIIMLFSPVVNNKFPNVAGFVISCDFYSRQQAPSSNQGEVFYATVPTSLTGGLGSSASRDGWRRTMRSTIIHEAKHITSYAERLSRGAPHEEAWLEEGTARHSEELYARVLSGHAWKSNAGYSAISCEVRPTTAGCTDRPYVMFKHFDGLADYLGSNGSLSPLGRTNDGDYNYYASAWALVRWAADLAPSEASFFQALTRGPSTGVANFEAAAARPWAQIVADWTMSLALDDYPGFAPAGAQSIGTWNLRDVFAGMQRDFPTFYPTPYPLRPRSVQFGTFTVQNPALRAGSGAVIELTGSWSGSQVLELRGTGGGPAAGTLRLAVTRVQ